MIPIRRIVLLGLILAALLAGCARAAPAVLKGSVTIWPIMPAEPSGAKGDPVNELLFTSRSLHIYQPDGRTLVKNVPFNADGTYEVELEPGTYLVSLPPSGIAYAPQLPQTIELESGETLELNIDIDTGIR